jgi:enoyl-CoA hydratase/carnithine racemase
MIFKKIFVDHSEQLVTLSINRPNALNAIDFDVMIEFEHLLEIVEKNPPKVFLFKGDSSGYVASGGDLVQFASLKTEHEGLQMAKKMASILNRIEALPSLNIALLNGNLYGGGCEMSLAFDVIYVQENALLGFTQAYFGLSPGWNGAIRLCERVGKSEGLNLLISQKKLSAEDAFRIGLAQELFHTEEQFLQRLNLFLSYPAHVLLGIKKAIQIVSDESQARTYRMQQELQNFSELWANDEHHKAVEKFLNRKK